MSLRPKRPAGDIFNLSFLDVITCAFGAIIMLLLITRHDDGKPGNTEAAKQQLEALITEETKVKNLSAQLEKLDQELQNKRKANDRLKQLQSRKSVNLNAEEQKSARLKRDKKGLDLVKQSLKISSTVRNKTPLTDVEVGGIPVNSDYVIFIIDTSGSMTLIWPEVMKEISNVLSIHPRVRGFQIMSDNGDYLMDGYAGMWITDSPRIRSNVIKLMRTWNAYSNSSPVEGLEKALRVYGHKGDNISIYIFGDDYTGDSFDRVINTLERMNTDSRTGKPLVKIHGIGFIHPRGIDPRLTTERKFSILMREVARRNGGAFVALPVR